MHPSTTDFASVPRFQPGYALYAAGICVWMALIACTGSTYMLPLMPTSFDPTVYVVAHQAAYVLSMFAVAAVGWRLRRQPTRLFTVGCFVSFAAALAALGAIVAGLDGTALFVLYGVALGIATTCGYIRWTEIVSVRPLSEVTSLLFVASGASVLSGVAFCLISLEARLTVFALLVAASLPLMLANERMAGRLAAAAGLQDEKGSASSTFAGLTSNLAAPALCACALVLAAPLVSIAAAGSLEAIPRTLLAQGANAGALVVLAFVIYRRRAQVSLVEAYGVLMPLLASAVVLSLLFGARSYVVVQLVADACFCVVSLLLLLTACSIAQRDNIRVSCVYGLLGGVVYLARTPEALLVVSSLPDWATTSYVLEAVLLYLLSVPALFLLRSRRDRAGTGVGEGTGAPAATDGAAAPQATSAPSTRQHACEVLARERGLTARQVELLKLMVSGAGTQRIAETLSLSESTIKTYRKTLYATLDVHSRQELLDLVDATRAK